MEQTDSKKILLSVLGVAILLVAVAGISYAVFLFTATSNKENVVNTGTISMSYTEGISNIMTITNAMPTLDEVGMKQREYFDFQISSNIAGVTNVNYQVLARNVTTGSNSLDPKYIKMYLEKQEGTQYRSVLTPTTFSSLRGVNGEGNQVRLLYSGKFSNDSEKQTTKTDNFILRMWLASNYPSDEIARNFKVKVDVKAAME